MKQEFVTLPREVVELALDAWARGCPPDCRDGMTDSGGVHPWGEAALIKCPSCQAVGALRAALDQPQGEQAQIGSHRDAQEVPFEAWWGKHGQFLRTGGGQYEKTFAWHAWCEATKKPQPQVEQEPVARVVGTGHLGGHFDWCKPDSQDYLPPGALLYTHPQPRREPLTDERLDAIVFGCGLSRTARDIARAIEAAHNIK